MSMRQRAALWVQKRILNPTLKRLLQAGLPVPGIALLETTGRTSGQPRHVPVTNGLDGDRFWIVSERGHHAAYVRNIAADPHVRVRTSGRWMTGRAHIVDDDPRRTLARLPSRFNARLVDAISTDPVVIRIDLDQQEGAHRAH